MLQQQNHFVIIKKSKFERYFSKKNFLFKFSLNTSYIKNMEVLTVVKKLSIFKKNKYFKQFFYSCE